MNKIRVTIQYSAALLLCAFTLSLTATAQEQASQIKKTTLTSADLASVDSSVGSAFHAKPTNLPGAKQKLAPINAKGARGTELMKLDPSFAPAVVSGPPTPTPTGTHMYPADLVSGGGPTVTSTTFHNIYVNLTSGTIASNWGNPAGFLVDLGKSSFIHLTDQYTGNSGIAVNYKTDSTTYELFAGSGNIVTDADIQGWLGYYVSHVGAGPGHIYHFYFMPGTDVCFDSTDSVCYSPDSPSTFYFCAYHGAATYNGYGTALYTVEPYQDVNGCAVQTPSPNGQLADSTNSVLSHETFETITDPLPGAGWTNQTSLDLNGYEIGDECQPLGNIPTFYINGKQYEVQLEYSNYYHACSMQPKNVPLI